MMPPDGRCLECGSLPGIPCMDLCTRQERPRLFCKGCGQSPKPSFTTTVVTTIPQWTCEVCVREGIEDAALVKVREHLEGRHAHHVESGRYTEAAECRAIIEYIESL